MTEASHPFRAGQFSPLRYPGGKGKIADFVRAVIRQSGMSDGTYVEPYAGGASVAIEMLLTGEVSKIAINDVSVDIYSFWKSVIDHTDELCDKVLNTPLTVDEWDRQKAILKAASDHDMLSVGFAAFYLNRTNRSGILNAGIIGGRAQTGRWLIDARYNAKALASKIQHIGRHRRSISVTNSDAIVFLEEGAKTWPKKTLIYLDPPYFAKGKHLYLHHYGPLDHKDVCEAVLKISKQSWMVSYDDTPEIEELYRGHPTLRYTIGYSARNYAQGREVMFFGPGVAMPNSSGSMNEIERIV